ncbi:MAG: bifunctional precorrin-2 dehydrogenase/sirohydrochlorin ferrochelatase [Deltaproteobacteria bacterium]
MGYLPLFLDVDGRRCVVVGGGPVAARKAAVLAEAGAEVHVVSPEFSAELESMAALLNLHRRPYRSGDLDGAAVVFACTDDGRLQRAIATDGRAAGALVNVVDEADASDFISGYLVHRGKVVVAVSTSGASPTLARSVGRRVEEAIGPEYGRAAEILGRLRPVVMDSIKSPEERSRVFASILDGGLLDLLASGRDQEAGQLIEGIIGCGFDVSETATGEKG